MPSPRSTDAHPPKGSTRRNTPIYATTITRRLEHLAALSDEPGKLTRLYLGRAHREAADLVAAWMREAGMTTRLDAVGNLIGRYAAHDGGRRTLLIGSHIDTVRDAGRYDGTLGVLAAIAVVHRLNGLGKRLPFAIEVVAFGDEEGVRFAGTLTGSRALAGRFDPAVLDEIDADGVSRRKALEAFGCDVARIPAEARDPAEIVGYLELHIEQGPVLESEGLPLAVVTAINGATRGRVTVTGEGGHAGTVPMRLRRDALAAASEMVLAVERRAAGEADLVGTVGMVAIPSSAPNVVPGTVTLSLDVRSPSDERRGEALEALKADFAVIAGRRGVAVETAVTYEAASASCDEKLSDALATAVSRTGLAVRRLASGAGHDGMSFKDRCPFAMLFVRCRGGVSHHPDEFASFDDIEIATGVLAECVETLAVTG